MTIDAFQRQLLHSDLNFGWNPNYKWNTTEQLFEKAGQKLWSTIAIRHLRVFGHIWPYLQTTRFNAGQRSTLWGLKKDQEIRRRTKTYYAKINPETAGKKVYRNTECNYPAHDRKKWIKCVNKSDLIVNYL